MDVDMDRSDTRALATPPPTVAASGRQAHSLFQARCERALGGQRLTAVENPAASRGRRKDTGEKPRNKHRCGRRRSKKQKETATDDAYQTTINCYNPETKGKHSTKKHANPLAFADLSGSQITLGKQTRRFHKKHHRFYRNQWIILT